MYAFPQHTLGNELKNIGITKSTRCAVKTIFVNITKTFVICTIPSDPFDIATMLMKVDISKCMNWSAQGKNQFS